MTQGRRRISAVKTFASVHSGAQAQIRVAFDPAIGVKRQPRSMLSAPSRCALQALGSNSSNGEQAIFGCVAQVWAPNGEAKLDGVDPQSRLNDIVSRIADQKISKIDASPP